MHNQERCQLLCKIVIFCLTSWDVNYELDTSPSRFLVFLNFELLPICTGTLVCAVLIFATSFDLEKKIREDSVHGL